MSSIILSTRIEFTSPIQGQEYAKVIGEVKQGDTILKTETLTRNMTLSDGDDDQEWFAWAVSDVKESIEKWAAKNTDLTI